MLTLTEAAKHMNVCKHTISRWHLYGVNGRKLRAIIRGCRVLFDRDDMEAFLIKTGDPAPSVKPPKADNSAAREYLRQNGYRI